MLRNKRLLGAISAAACPVLRVTALLGLLACVAACSGTPPQLPPSQPTAVVPEQALARGDYAGAARAWQKAALTATPEQAGVLRLSAAEAWLLGDRPDQARELVRWLERDLLAAPDQARMNLLLADLALRAERPDEAEILLQKAEAGLPDSYREHYVQLRATTAKLLSRPGARDFSALASLSQGDSSYQPEQALALLHLLEDVPSGELAARALDARIDQTLSGWLDLALVIRDNLVDGDGLIPAMTAWKARHPNHYLAEADGLDLWLRYRDGFMPPRKVAVLLPESGRLLAAAEAIRDGIVSAYLDAPGSAEILFVDSGEEAESAAAAYFAARDRGAEWIIGPLQKPTIEALLRLAALATPMLALNDLPDGPAGPATVAAGLSGQIFGLSLSQDEEVRWLARSAAAAGFRSAIVLAPESPWGERMAGSFSDVFLQDNRQILASVRYRESENDHSADLQRVLMIDQSEARKKKLENALQIPLEFEAVRRGDVDVIFLAASPNQGRQIRPQLRFYGAGDIPVYATGRIYSGQRDRIGDQDLNGVRIPLTPLELGARFGPENARLASIKGGTMNGLYALGRDAWNILPWLDLMKRDRDFTFAGASGNYRAPATAGNLQREPGLAIFRAGIPVALRDETLVNDTE